MAFQGKWKLIKESSSNLDYFQYMTIQFTVKKDEITDCQGIWSATANAVKQWF